MVNSKGNTVVIVTIGVTILGILMTFFIRDSLFGGNRVYREINELELPTIELIKG